MKIDSVDSKTKQSLVWFTLVPFGVHFFRFANSIILARLLTPNDFGIMGIVSVIFYYCNSVTNFGLGNAIVQRKSVVQQHFNAFFCFNIFISIVLYLIFLFSSESIAGFFNEPDIASAIEVFAIMFLISAFIAVPTTYHKRNLNFKTLAIIEVVKVTCSMAISLTLALNDFGFWSMIYALLVAQFVALCLTYSTSTIKAKLSFDYRFFKELVNFGVWSFCWGQVKILGDSVDKIIVGKMLGTTMLGYYEKADGLAKMPYEQFSTRLSMVSFSAFSRIQDKLEEIKRYLSNLMIINMFICAPIFVGLALVAENFTLVLLGEQWREMIRPLQVLCISFLFASTASPIISVNMASGKIKQQTIIRLFCLILLVVGLLFSASKSIFLASLTLVCFNAILLVLSFLLVKRSIDITWSDLFYYLQPALISTLIMATFVYCTVHYVLPEQLALNLILSTLVGAISYAACFFLIPFKQWRFLRKKINKSLKKILR